MRLLRAITWQREKRELCGLKNFGGGAFCVKELTLKNQRLAAGWEGAFLVPNLRGGTEKEGLEFGNSSSFQPGAVIALE